MIRVARFANPPFTAPLATYSPRAPGPSASFDTFERPGWSLAEVASLWRTPGLRVAEKASLPRRDPLGAVGPGVIHAPNGRLFIAASPLYGDASRAHAFRGTEVTALDARKLKALNGGRMPSGEALASMVASHPEVVLGRATFDEAGVVGLDVPPGSEVSVWTGSQAARGGAPTQAMAKIGQRADLARPPTREIERPATPPSPWAWLLRLLS